MKNILKLLCLSLYSIVCGMMLFGLSASAYIDPSVTTYLIQVVAGVVIAVGAAAGLYFRKAKTKVKNTLGIDENKNKELETDDIIIKDED